jgi:hypothetical protein
VMFIFQPAEETLSGARAMLEAGAFNEKPDAILGFHNWPPLATGTVGWHPDAVMASSDAFDVTIKGIAGHGAHPHLAVDAVIGAAQFVNQVQTVISREIAPISSAVLTIGRINGGTVRNIIASSVEMNASVRTLESAVADKVEAAVRRILEGLKTGLRVDYELKWTKLTPVLRNDKPTMQRVLNVARELLGSANVIEMPAPSMGSEDYAWFAERAPSAHLRIGSKIEGHETAIHRTDYQLNEKMMPFCFASASSSTFVAPEMSGNFSPASSRALVLTSASCIAMARSAAASASAGSMTITPHSSAMITSPGWTATPPQEIGAQNEPPMPMRLVVIAERPRHHTGTPYWRISPISATTPSIITPATLATLAA